MLKPAARRGSTQASTLPQCTAPSAGKSRVRSIDNRTSVTPMERRTFQALTDGGGSIVEAQIPNRMSTSLLLKRTHSVVTEKRETFQRRRKELADAGRARWLGRED